jgi:hypothetical protein
VVKGRWYITEHAVNGYVFARRWPKDDEHWQLAESELIRISEDASYRRTDRHGRELWRSPSRTGGGLRWVIDPRPHPGGPLPRVAWVGFGKPPDHFFEPDPA